MKKTVWLSFFISLVAVNGIAWVGEYYTGIYIALPFRLALVLGISVGTAVFVGSMALVNNLEHEQPLTRNEGRRRPPGAPEKDQTIDPEAASKD